MPLIKLENIEKIYGDHGVPVVALENVNLNFEQSDFAAIVGPSGSGKTTLLNIIGGLDRPTTGHVIIREQNITGMSGNQLIDFRLHNIGFVFQAYNLIPVLTAIENVEFIMLLQRTAKSQRRARAEELLKAVGLDAQVNRRPFELSGGQQQRVAVARALASMPSFVLADEPTANLDSASAENLLDIMESLNKRRGMTFIFSTHDLRVVRRARRVINLQDGRVISDKTVAPE
jgi:putative ABC transport system ATP-binding protein